MIKEVARLAKVSVGTVSRVLNRHPSVNPELRERVQAVIDEIGYRPNAVARSLRSQRSRTFGLIIPDVTNPFFAELVKSVEQYAAALDYGIILGNVEESTAAEAHYIQVLRERRVDGLLVVPCVDTREIKLHSDTKMVLIDRPVETHLVVLSDHKGGAAAAVMHLIELGHRRIACIAGPRGLPVAAERYAGFQQAMTQVFPGWNASASPVEFASFDYGAGYDAAVRLLNASPRPTAIFAASDQQAIGALRAAADLRIRVPADLSIVGFDDIPLSSLITPRLTTVSQSIKTVSRVAVDLLYKLCHNQAVETPARIPTDLVVRDSSAACHKSGRKGGRALPAE